MPRPFRITESRIVYQSRLMRVREDHLELPRGTRAVFNVAEVRPGSTVLALDADGDARLIREYKWGVDRVSIEAISGGIEEGESPLDCARRELREEGGLEADEWTPLGAIDPFTSHVVSPNYIFLARGLTPVPSLHEEGEVIEPYCTPLAHAVELALAGEITHAASVVAILRAARLFGV
jgi:ADP-ribose pyrophosphatase